MSRRRVDAEAQREKRRLRLRIGRLRRRIDGRLRSTEGRLRQTVSWRNFVRRCPGPAVVGAFGVGLALSAGLGSRRLARWLGLGLARQAMKGAGRQLWRELGRIWKESTPEAATRATGECR